MAKFKTWPNAEKYVIAWLNRHTDFWIYSELPTNFGAQLPAVQITRSGGSPTRDTVIGGRRVGNDRTIDIEIKVFAQTRAEIWPAVQQIETAIGGLAANGDQSWYVDDVAEIFPFAIDNYENESKQRAIATYGLTVRPQP